MAEGVEVLMLEVLFASTFSNNLYNCRNENVLSQELETRVVSSVEKTDADTRDVMPFQYE